jgi:HD-like signal output (HDOD) protein
MNILQRMHEIHELPALPEVLFKVQALVNSDEGNAATLGRITEQDPSLTTKILKVANSSYFGQVNQRISSLQLAIARIGFNEVRNIVTAISCIKQFSKRSNLLDYKAFWRHSLAAAYLTKIIADTAQVKYAAQDRQFYFLAGLLHDIGILVFDQFFHKEFEGIVDYALKKECSFLTAESFEIGKETHQVVGSALLELWKIDPVVISGVRFHHHGLDKVPEHHRVIAQVTYLAEYVLCNCSLGSFEGTVPEIEKGLLDSLRLSQDSMSALFDAAEAQVEKSDLIVAMGMSASPQGELRRI